MKFVVFLNTLVNPWREYAAEFVGTFFLVFISSVLFYVERVYGGLGIVGLALGLGFVYGALIFATSPISGGFLNPALTVSLWLVKRVSGTKTVFYLIFQFLASFIAGIMIYMLFGASALNVNLGSPVLGFGVSFETALILEAIFSAGMVWVLFATYVDKRGPVSFMPIVLGFYLTCVSLAALPLTGAVFNPARAIGPLVLSKSYSYLLVYTAAPFFASLLGLVYEYLYLRRKKN